jgi:hypothetical protein
MAIYRGMICDSEFFRRLERFSYIMPIQEATTEEDWNTTPNRLHVRRIDRQCQVALGGVVIFQNIERLRTYYMNRNLPVEVDFALTLCGGREGDTRERYAIPELYLAARGPFIITYNLPSITKYGTAWIEHPGVLSLHTFDREEKDKTVLSRLFYGNYTAASDLPPKIIGTLLPHFVVDQKSTLSVNFDGEIRDRKTFSIKLNSRDSRFSDKEMSLPQINGNIYIDRDSIPPLELRIIMRLVMDPENVFLTEKPKKDPYFTVKFSWDGDLLYMAVTEKSKKSPTKNLPIYINLFPRTYLHSTIPWLRLKAILEYITEP